MMMTAPTYFAYDVLRNTIIGSAANIKKAGDPTTPQYKELCAMKAMQPTFSVAVKEITRNKKKETYKDLTIAAMRTFIEGKNDSNALAEFEVLVNMASYPIVKSWFLSNYKGVYKKTETKKDMTKAKIKAITNKKNVVSLPDDMKKGA